MQMENNMFDLDLTIIQKNVTMDKKVFADQSQKCCSTSGVIPGLPVFCFRKPCLVARDGLCHVSRQSVPTWWYNAEDERGEVKTDLSKPRAQWASSKKKKRRKKTADPILVCTVLWSTLIWQLIRELSASVCHLKKTAATWRRGPMAPRAVTATADSKALTLSLLRTLLLPLWLVLHLSFHPSRCTRSVACYR